MIKISQIMSNVKTLTLTQTLTGYHNSDYFCFLLNFTIFRHISRIGIHQLMAFFHYWLAL